MITQYEIESWTRKLRAPGKVHLTKENRLALALLLEDLLAEREAVAGAKTPQVGEQISTLRAIQIVLARCRMHDSHAYFLRCLLRTHQNEEERNARQQSRPGA